MKTSRHLSLTVILLRLGLLCSALAQSLAAEPAKHRFDVPADNAVEALRIFTQQCGQEIVYSPDKVKGTQTREVKGEFSPREALERMLAGTNLVASESKNGVLTINRGGSPNAERAAQASPSLARPDEPLEMDAYDVTVTVQKRPQSVQDVPISMTALSAKRLEQYRVENVRDLSRLTPNLLVSSFSQSSPTLAIRGANNTFSQIGVSKPVAVVIDDVFIPRNTAASFELFDLDSAQVLRGPQGTLFGRNVTGGAIVFNTRLPSFYEREGELQADYGNYADVKLQSLVSGPINDSVAAKISLYSHTHDGYGRDRLTGREQDDQDSSGLRAQVLLKTSDRLKGRLSVDYSDDRNGGRTLSSNGLGSDGDRRTSELGYPQRFARTMWGVSGHLGLAVPEGEFSSITAYRESRSAEDYSGVGTSYLFLSSGSQAVSRDQDHPGTFTQELRYASPKWTFMDFVSGLYCLYEDAYRKLTSQAFAAKTGAVVTNQISDQWVVSRSYAGYWDGVFHLIPKLDLTLGGRCTIDEKKASVVRTDVLAPSNSYSAFGLRKRWSEFTPRAVLTWSPLADAKVYASVTKGYTSGGFNTDAAVLAAFSKPFDPETVTNYELGLKSLFLNKRLRTNIAVFREKYRDKQELYFDTNTRILTIVNASKATMRGAEFELSYSPLPGLNLSGALGLLDATYDSFLVPGVLNYTGNPLGSSPKHKVSLDADYEFPVGKLGYLTATVAYSNTAGYYTGATKDPNLYVPSYSLVNASVGFQTLDRKWWVTLWGRNLGDTAYLLTPSTQTVLAEYLGDPRTYGITLGLRF